MRHLRERMHAGVGAAGTIQLELARTGSGRDRALDLSLDRARVLLHLPAAVPRAGVFNRQLEAHDPLASSLHSLEHLSELPQLLAVGRPVTTSLCRNSTARNGLVPERPGTRSEPALAPDGGDSAFGRWRGRGRGSGSAGARDHQQVSVAPCR